jgi:hypothetical protein
MRLIAQLAPGLRHHQLRERTTAWDALKLTSPELETWMRALGVDGAAAARACRAFGMGPAALDAWPWPPSAASTCVGDDLRRADPATRAGQTGTRLRALRDTFSRRQDDLNEVLVPVGLRVNDQGQVARGPAAATLSEAARHASSLRAELRTHPEVLRYCTLEILAKDLFHASLEAVKSVADRLRQLTGQGLDGARLADAVLMPGHGTARVAINANATGARAG